jgi:hypothetical protein
LVYKKLVSMSDYDGISWYINMSPFNRYLFMDIMKAIGVAALTIGASQVLPVPIAIRDFVTDAGGVALVFYIFSTQLKQFPYF